MKDKIINLIGQSFGLFLFGSIGYACGMEPKLLLVVSGIPCILALFFLFFPFFRFSRGLI